MAKDLVPTSLTVLSPKFYHRIQLHLAREESCLLLNILVSNMDLATVWCVQNTNNNSHFRKTLAKVHLALISNKNLTSEFEIIMPILL